MENFSVNHFPKHVCVSLSTHFTLTQSLLSHFLTVCSILFTVPSHPQPPPAIPSRPHHPGLISAPFLSFSTRYLSRPANPSHPVIHYLTDRPSHRSHRRTARALHQSASPKVTPTVAQLDLIRSDQI